MSEGVDMNSPAEDETPTPEKLLRDIVDEMQAAGGWAFPCLQPHSESVVAAREWLAAARVAVVRPTRDAEDGECQRCGGLGCPACDARWLDWDVRLVADLSAAFPTTTVPLLAEIVAFIATWKLSVVGVAVSDSQETPRP